MGNVARNDDDVSRGISDEEWARFAQQAGEAGDAPKEPSARARMVTERLRREEEQRAKAQKKRFRRTPPAATEPPGWRTGPAWQEMNDRGRGRRRFKAFLGIVLVAGLALIAIRPELVIDKLTGETEARQDARNGAPLSAESVRPTGAPQELPPDQPTLKDPFRGSPALQWADGVAGIEVPEAQALGGISKAKVAEGLELAKQFLITANLDPATVLHGERPEAALKLLEPKLEGNRPFFVKALDAPGKEQDPTLLFTRFQPAEVKLVGDVVKTRGRMAVVAGEEQGEVKVSVDYTFVYPLVQAAPGSDKVERTIVRRQMDIYLRDPARWQMTKGTFQLGKFDQNFGNVLCAVYDGYLHPSFGGGTTNGVEPSGQPVDPYDRSKDLADTGTEECGVISRS